LWWAPGGEHDEAITQQATCPAGTAAGVRPNADRVITLVYPRGSDPWQQRGAPGSSLAAALLAPAQRS
jgi:hypothetical protein